MTSEDADCRLQILYCVLQLQIEEPVTRQLSRLVTVIALAAWLRLRAARAFRQGDSAMKAGDLDQAVAYYRTAVQASPDNPNYKIALERAHARGLARAFREGARFEEQDQLEAARGEYRLASEYDPTNRQAAAKVVALDQTIRERIEAARPRPAIEQLRERARAASAPPMLNPASREPLIVRFNTASLRDILNSIGNAHRHQHHLRPRGARIGRSRSQLDGVTLEQALEQIMTMNQLSYKVLTERSIFVFPDTQQKHAQYDEQVDPDVLRLARRRDGAVADPQHHHPPAAASPCSR